MKTEEGNKLIDEFMGITPEESKGFIRHVAPNSESKPIIIEILGYNVSWDRLMPVVEEIERSGANVVIEHGECEITTWKRGFSMTGMFEVKIDAVWHIAIEYIEWYNKNIKE